MARRFAALGLSACALTLWAGPVRAEEVDDATRAAARQIGYVGVQAYQAKDYATATEKLEKAFRVLQAPSLGLWSARALVKLNKLVEAQERYLKVTRLPIVGGEVEVQKKAQADAAKELSALVPRVPNVVIELEGAERSEVMLSIDGIAVSSELVGEARPVNPGSHQILGMRGADRVEVWLDIAEGEHKPATVHFASASAPSAPPPAAVPAAAPVAAARPVEPAPEAAPVHEADTSSTRRTVAWATIGAGAAALVVGSVSGAIAVSKREGFRSNEACAGTACGTSQQSNVDSYNSLRTVSSIGLLAGAVVGTAGVVMLLTAPRPTPAPSAALFFSPTLSGVRGTF